MRDRDLWTIMRDADALINRLALPSNTVVVFDIDMTLLNERGERIEPVCWFYEKILGLGYIPILITARPSLDAVVEETEFQLYVNNILNYESIYFKDPDEKNYYLYKLNSRRNIWDRGYHIAMSIGDQPWDIGDYGGIGVLLPKQK